MIYIMVPPPPQRKGGETFWRPDYLGAIKLYDPHAGGIKSRGGTFDYLGGTFKIRSMKKSDKCYFQFFHLFFLKIMIFLFFCL